VVGLTFAAAVTGGVTGDFESRWYARLRKPRWQPSGRTIGLIWSIIYPTILVSGTLLWLRRGRGVSLVAILFVAQSALNAAWPLLFTRARMLGAATIECAVLAAVNVLLIATAWRVRRSAALLLVPYAGWTAFATFLTWTIQRLNHQRRLFRPGRG
jgi:tryptophan-rich sensory protein